MHKQLLDAARPLEKIMKNAIESAAKTASGEPIWRLTKG
jgi:hypothetical protein